MCGVCDDSRIKRVERMRGWQWNGVITAEDREGANEAQRMIFQKKSWRKK